MKKIFNVLLAVLLSAMLSSCAVQKDDIYVFFTSDVHCGIEDNMGLSGVKALVDEAKKEHQFVSLVDCGDFLQGGAVGSLSKGKLVIDFHVIVSYGVNIMAVADNLVSSVKYRVEDFTGLEVEKINVFVEGVKVID